MDGVLIAFLATFLLANSLDACGLFFVWSFVYAIGGGNVSFIHNADFRRASLFSSFYSVTVNAVMAAPV